MSEISFRDEVMSMSKIIATWIIAISLLITACYSIASYNMEKDYLSGTDCGNVKEEINYWSA